MARPAKQGLEYFPQDADIHNDRKIRRLRKEFCANGYMVYDYIKCLIYKENGYWIELNEDLIFDVADFLDCGITSDFVNKVIEFCFNINLFNRKKYEEIGILTSSGIQKRFLKAKRGGVIAAEMIVIAAETPVIAAIITETKKNALKTDEKTKKNNKIKTAETPVIAAETPVIAAETPVIAAETPVIAAESTQSKLKEIKVKENNSIIKENEEDFAYQCKFYRNNWSLSTKPEICAHFFFNDNNFDYIRNDCLKVLMLYYLPKENETILDALKSWSNEFNAYLNQINKQKTMEGTEGYPFHFLSWLRKQDAKLKMLPRGEVKKSEFKEKTAQQILRERI